MKACFFTTSAYSQVLQEQYTLTDIKILEALGFKVTFANKLRNIPLGYDLYYSWWASGSFFPVSVALACRRPSVVVAGGNEAIPYRDSQTNQPHGYLAANAFKRAATRFTLSRSTAVVAVSDFMVPGLRELGCERAHVIQNCVDPDNFVPDHTIAKEFVTTSFRVDEGPARIKRGENFIRAAARLKPYLPGIRFLVIGHKGDAFARLSALAKDLGVSDCLVFSGGLQNSDVVRQLQRSACFVQPSDTETFGVAVAEAMSAECPVVISRAGALPEVAGDCAIYVDQNSPESIANGVLAVMQMPTAGRAALGRAARQRVMQHFSIDRRKSAIADLLSGLIPG